MAEELSKNIGNEVPPEKGKQWIKTYQDQNPDSLKAVFYGSDILQAILDQQNCVGIRIYKAIGDDGLETFVLVGAKGNGNNIWPSSTGDSTPQGIVAENGHPCPPYCNYNE